jgi:hypothetical protein
LMAPLVYLQQRSSVPDGRSWAFAPSNDIRCVSPDTPITRGDVELAWVCLTQLLPLSRFLTFSGVCVSHTLAALFHAATAPRVSTFRVFPTLAAVTVSGPLPS